MMTDVEIRLECMKLATCMSERCFEKKDIITIAKDIYDFITKGPSCPKPKITFGDSIGSSSW